ncbi:unnamed protein product, partial [marine sediment metagenome]
MKALFDVIIVGAGPAGMFTAYKLLESSPRIKIGIIDKGKDIYTRLSSTFTQNDLISGAGGAGLFSDGKLILTLNAGGKLQIPQSDANRYVAYINNLL